MATVAARFLLGWMSKTDALDALNECEFDEPITRKKAIKLWQEYRDKVNALDPRDPIAPVGQELTAKERADAQAHLARIRLATMVGFSRIS